MSEPEPLEEYYRRHIIARNKAAAKLTLKGCGWGCGGAVVLTVLFVVLVLALGVCHTAQLVG